MSIQLKSSMAFIRNNIVVKTSNRTRTFKKRRLGSLFLARRDECPESDCRTTGVGVGVGVHKKFNLPITPEQLKKELSYFTCTCIVTRMFYWYQNQLPTDLDLEI